MAKGWTWERRRRQGERIRIWKPWQDSTGPTTQAGKKRISQNAFKGGTTRDAAAVSESITSSHGDFHEVLRPALCSVQLSPLPPFQRPPQPVNLNLQNTKTICGILPGRDSGITAFSRFPISARNAAIA